MTDFEYAVKTKTIQNIRDDLESISNGVNKESFIICDYLESKESEELIKILEKLEGKIIEALSIKEQQLLKERI